MARFWAHAAALSLVSTSVHALGLSTEFHQAPLKLANKRGASMGSTAFNKSAAPEWMLNIESFTGSCAISQNCLRSTSLPGTCTVRVDPAKAQPLCSTTLTTSGKDALLINGKKYASSGKSAPCGILPTADMTWTSKAASSSFNLCWHDSKVSRSRLLAVRTEPLASKCFWVNGLCWLWASPCSGSCATVTLGNQHPGMLRYATQAEFDAALPTFGAQRTEFFAKCAASLLEHNWTHCDDSDVFSRHGPSAAWASDELVLIYEQFDTTGAVATVAVATTATTGATGAVAAVGDPHLVNVYGQHFDLHQVGRHTLLQLPLEASARVETLLRVDAEAQQLGAMCADMYFTSLNVTGRWVHTAYRSESLQFTAGASRASGREHWLHFGSLALKIAGGHTAKGTEYLNFFVKHLSSLGMRVGGLLGEGDHTEAATLSAACKKTRVSL